MYDFLRAASVVPRVSVADTSANTAEIIKGIKETENADVVVFPELAMTGYTCGDLFFQKNLQGSVLEGLKKICEAVGDTVVFVGAPLLLRGQLYNCAVCICCGKIYGIIPKTFIPNYNEFYEQRWFASSEVMSFESISAEEIGIDGGYEIPVGRDLIFDINGCVRVAAEICEDVWTAIPPSSFSALNGAELIVNLSASNEAAAKAEYRRTLVMQQSARCMCAYVYTSAGAGESTTDLVFSGHSIIAENGAVIAENGKTADDAYILVHDIDIGKITADRAKNNTFSESAALYGRLQPSRRIRIAMRALCGNGELYEVNKAPFVPAKRSDCISRCMEIFEMQLAGLKKRLEVTGCRPVVGVSGGLDSTLALLVAVETVRRLGRPLRDVVGITMPCFGTSGRTYNNSLELMKTLGITYEEINIRSACEQHFSDIGHDGKTLDLTYENSQARERTQILMDYAGKIGGLVVGTGDLSELALGWCTYNADHMSMYGVNSGIPKTLVRRVVESIIECNIFPDSTAVLRDIADTPISPELLPPDESGKISQETESLVGPYALHDFFLYNVIRFGFEPEKIYFMAKKAFAGEFDDKTILKWLKSFYKRFFTQQFKRSCMPDGVKVGSIALSPRGDWRMPSDAAAADWIRAVDGLGD